MDSPMKYNSLGVAFVSDDLPKRLRKKVDKRWRNWKKNVKEVQV